MGATGGRFGPPVFASGELKLASQSPRQWHRANAGWYGVKEEKGSEGGKGVRSHCFLMTHRLPLGNAQNQTSLPGGRGVPCAQSSGGADDDF